MKILSFSTHIRQIGRKRVFTIIVLLIIISVVASIYNYDWLKTIKSGISIEKIETVLKEDGRYIKIQIKASRNLEVNIANIFINQSKIVTFTIDKQHLNPNESATINIWYYWLQGKTYEVLITTTKRTQIESTFNTPAISPTSSLNITSVMNEVLYPNQPSLMMKFNYNISSYGFESVYVGFFLYKLFQNETQRPIYLFYDQNYMPEITLQRAEKFYNLAISYGMNITKINWNLLNDLVESKPLNIILILFNPLMTVSGDKFYDAAPSCLLDPNEDGYVKEHSLYHKSIVYDWEMDRGLVFISIGSIQAPSKWIIAKDGTAYEPKDKDYSDRFFADTPGAFRGWGPKTIYPTRIGQTLELNTWDGDYYLDTAILNSSIGSNNYYIYGLAEDTSNWANPCYIKVGEGGWLFCGDGWNLDDGTVAKDLVMIILHAPWNSEWFGSNSWSYDSGSKSYLLNSCALDKVDQISTGWIGVVLPSNFTLRIIRMLYDGDREQYVLWEKYYSYENLWTKEFAISIENLQTGLEMDGRYINFEVKATGNYSIDITKGYIDDTECLINVDGKHLEPGTSTNVSVRYPWASNKTYLLRVETKQGSYDEEIIKTTEVKPLMNFNLTAITRDENQNRTKLIFNYDINITGFSYVNTGFFIYKSYNIPSREIYVFYDPRYVPESTMQKIDAFITLTNGYGINVNKIDWDALKGLVESKPRVILILFNPLKNENGDIFYNSVPSCLLDPGEDGFIRNGSVYGKSVVYDWMKDHGLVFISVGSTQAPSEWIIAKNGTAYEPEDKDHSDKFFVDTPGAFRGMGFNTIMPTRIGQTLGLHAWFGSWRLDTSVLEASIGVENYYSYGFLPNTNWSQPCYIKVGEGGWLYCGDGLNLDDGGVVKDLAMIILHAPWNSEWLGLQSWNYDSGFKVYPINGGTLDKVDQVSTGWIAGEDIDSFVLRILSFAYDRDRNRYIITEEINNYSLES